MLKTALFYQTSFPARVAAERELFAYIERYYNRQWRLQSALGYITPEQAERKVA